MGLTIGQLAEAAGHGVGVETIRFYERRGLIAEPPRTAAGHRQYAPDTVARLRFIRRAQGVGFTLGEVSELLALRVDDEATCASVRERVRAKLDDVAGKIAGLRDIESALKRLVAACDARRTSTGDCPILEELKDASA